MITTLQRLPGNTIEIILTLPWDKIKISYDKIVEKSLAEIELSGFRKGKAPRELALKQIDKNKVFEKVVQELLPEAYAESISQNELKPIINPHIHLLDAEEGKDWKVKAVTCEKPAIEVGDYKGAVNRAKATKANKIWLPTDPKKPEEKKDQELTVGETLDAIYLAVKVDISPILVEQEVNRSLSNLISETQKLGLTIEQYLQAQGKTSEQLRKEHQIQAQKTLTLEFALEEIAEKEKVVVSDKEIEAVLQNAKSEDEKKALTQNRYFITSLLRRQKTLSVLAQSGIVKV